MRCSVQLLRLAEELCSLEKSQWPTCYLSYPTNPNDDTSSVVQMPGSSWEAMKLPARPRLPELSSKFVSRIEARCKNASALRLRFSQSLASLRHRLSQASVRSTIQRFGKTTNPFVRSERLHHLHRQMRTDLG